MQNKTAIHMSFVEELKPAIFFGRLMGIAPYKIVEKHLRLSPIVVSYSIIVHVAYVYLLFRHVDPTVKTWEQTTLMVIRIALVCSALSAGFISSVTRHRKLCDFVNRINRFDTMTNLCRDNAVTRKREAIVSASVVVPIVILAAMQVHVNFALNVNWRNFQWGFSLHYIGFGTIVSRYSTMVSCVLRRFQHLNRLFIPGHQANTVGVRNFRRGYRSLHDAWILHADLVEASEELNSMFNYQSSIWLSALAFNVITRLYSLWNGGMGMITWLLTINVLSTVHSVLLLANLLALCHTTAEEQCIDGYLPKMKLDVILISSLSFINAQTVRLTLIVEANKVGSTLFSSRSKIFQNNVGWFKEDIFSIGQYFVLRRFHFISAAGLLRIDLPLLQTIAGVITTYLVILKTSHDI